MDIADKVKLIVLSIVWVVWGLVCLIWTVESGEIIGGIFHLLYYIYNVGLIWAAAGWLFIYNGADIIGKWWLDRKERS